MVTRCTFAAPVACLAIFAKDFRVVGDGQRILASVRHASSERRAQRLLHELDRLRATARRLRIAHFQAREDLRGVEHSQRARNRRVGVVEVCMRISIVPPMNACNLHAQIHIITENHFFIFHMKNMNIIVNKTKYLAT